MYKGIILAGPENDRQVIDHSIRKFDPYRHAHVLREHGWYIEVIDFIYAWKIEELTAYLQAKIDKNTKFISISTHCLQWSLHLDIILSWLKINYPHLPIISSSLVYQGTEKVTKHLDYILYGYAENGLLALLKYLFSNGGAPKIVVQDNKNIIPCDEFYPMYDTTNIQVIYHNSDFIHFNEWLPIYHNLGCPFKCSFCYLPSIGIKSQFLEKKLLHDSLQNTFDRFGASLYNINDLTFNSSTKKIQHFTDGIKNLSFKPTFAAFCRPDNISAQKELLLAINCCVQFYGVETMDSTVQKIIRKNLDIDKLKSSLLEVKNYFYTHNNGIYRGTVGLILGLPETDINNAMSSYEWLIKHWSKEAVTTNTLNIRPVIKTIENQTKHNSLMAINPEYYGYEFMSEEEIQKEKEYIIQNEKQRVAAPGDFLHGSMTQFAEYYQPDYNYYPYLPWKSKNTNLIRAMSTLHDIYNHPKIRKFSMHHHEIQYNSLTCTLESRFKHKSTLRSIAGAEFLKLKDRDFTRHYINKKLATI